MLKLYCLLNNIDKSFDLTAKQYTTYFEPDPNMSLLPVYAHFNSPKFQKKKPRTKDNHNIGLLGLLEDIDTKPSGEATLFHVAVDCINSFNL